MIDFFCKETKCYKKYINYRLMDQKKKADDFFSKNNFEDAIIFYKKYILSDITLQEKCINLNQIGSCYFNLNKFKEAIESYKKALELFKIDDIYCNIGSCFTNLKLYDKALDYYGKALKIKKTKRVFKSMANIYFYKKEYENSIEYYNKALEMKILPELLYDLSFPHLASRHFDIGFELYENRLLFKCKNIGETRLELPQLKNWDGTSKCNNLLILSEQGLGDNILFYRYIIELSEKFPNMKITYFCRRQLPHIFKKYLYNIDIISNLYFTNSYDYKIYIMSLPYILKIRSITPNIKNYIKINPYKNKIWENKLLNLKKFKIGISWKGLLSSFIDKDIPYEKLEILSKLDASIICLHKKEDIQNIDKNKFENSIYFYNIDEEKSFEDTICILNNIDLLITIDSCLTYIAGIMNINTLLLLGKDSDWRWFNYNHDSTPWYNSVKIIKCLKDKNDWDSVLKDTKKEVNKLIKNPQHKFCNVVNLAVESNNVKKTSVCSIPVSIGELWDKYTILLIKKEMIKDIEKNNLVIHELNKLKKYIDKFSIDENKMLELKNCNQKLWNIEDSIREKERKKEFDKEFIKLARSVYFNNDERAKLKNNISLLFNSDIIEVKSYKKYTDN